MCRAGKYLGVWTAGSGILLSGFAVLVVTGCRGAAGPEAVAGIYQAVPVGSPDERLMEVAIPMHSVYFLHADGRYSIYLLGREGRGGTWKVSSSASGERSLTLDPTIYGQGTLRVGRWEKGLALRGKGVPWELRKIRDLP